MAATYLLRRVTKTSMPFRRQDRREQWII